MNFSAQPRRRSTHSQLTGVVRRGVALTGSLVRSPDDSPCVKVKSQSGVSNECPTSVQTLSQLGLSDVRGLTSVQQVSKARSNQGGGNNERSPITWYCFLIREDVVTPLSLFRHIFI